MEGLFFSPSSSSLQEKKGGEKGEASDRRGVCGQSVFLVCFYVSCTTVSVVCASVCPFTSVISGLIQYQLDAAVW